MPIETWFLMILRLDNRINISKKHDLMVVIEDVKGRLL